MLSPSNVQYVKERTSSLSYKTVRSPIAKRELRNRTALQLTQCLMLLFMYLKNVFVIVILSFCRFGAPKVHQIPFPAKSFPENFSFLTFDGLFLIQHIVRGGAGAYTFESAVGH